MGEKAVTALVAGVLLAAGLAGCSTPAPQVTVDEYTFAELLERRDSSLEALARSMRLEDPPDVEFVRFVARNEMGETIAACLGEVGIEAQASSDGTGFLILGNPPPSQGRFIDESIYACFAKYPVDPRYHVELSDSQYRVLYDYFVGELTECLREHGEIVADDAPSFETFKESYAQTGWSPYSQELVLSLDDTRLNVLLSECPQAPPDSVLYPFSPAVP